LKYGEDVDLSENEKKTHAYTVLREWPSAREQLRLGQLYASEHGINLGENLLANQQYHALSVYNKLSTQTGTILENILEWDGSFDQFANDMYSRIPLFLSFDLDTIENELKRSAKEHHSTKKNRYIMNLLEQMNESVISGSEDLQPSSLECRGTAQNILVRVWMNFLIHTHYQPTSMRLTAKAMEKTSTFCVQLYQLTSKGRSLTHWTTLTVFGISIEWSKISIEWSLTFLRAVVR